MCKTGNDTIEGGLQAPQARPDSIASRSLTRNGFSWRPSCETPSRRMSTFRRCWEPDRGWLALGTAHGLVSVRHRLRELSHDREPIAVARNCAAAKLVPPPSLTPQSLPRAVSRVRRIPRCAGHCAACSSRMLRLVAAKDDDLTSTVRSAPPRIGADGRG